MEEYKIESHHPMPTTIRGVINKAEAIGLHKMRVGDSIFIKNQSSQGAIPRLAYSYGYKVGKKFSGRTEKLGARVWRIA